ncbi:MAG: hypothetical protein QM775_16710 [Pirellulales bacterium]
MSKRNRNKKTKPAPRVVTTDAAAVTDLADATAVTELSHDDLPSDRNSEVEHVDPADVQITTDESDEPPRTAEGYRHTIEDAKRLGVCHVCGSDDETDRREIRDQKAPGTTADLIPFDRVVWIIITCPCGQRRTRLRV